MDRPITIEERRRHLVRRVGIAVVALAVIAFLFAASIEWLRPSVARKSVITARVTRGTIDASVDATGTIVPLVDQVVSSPVEARVVRIDRKAGDRVRRGDVLLTLDNAASELDAVRLADRVAQRESVAMQLRLSLEENVASQRAQIEQRKLDAEILRYSAQQKATLRREGLIAEQEALSSATAAKKADIEVRQLEEALTRSLRSREVQLAAAVSDLNTARRERADSLRQLELAQLRADRDGVVTWAVAEEGATVRRGDVVARISDLSSYRVAATISDVHAAKLAPGLRVEAQLEGERLGGAIESVDPRIESGVVKFFVTLDAPSHPRLRNNQRVDLSVVTATRPGALVVRRGALGRTSGSDAFVVRGDEVVRVPVRFGLVGNDTIEIVDGISEGEEVVISDMSDHERVERLRLD